MGPIYTRGPYRGPHGAPDHIGALYRALSYRGPCKALGPYTAPIGYKGPYKAPPYRGESESEVGLARPRQITTQTEP